RFRMAAFGPQLHHQWIASLVWALLLTGISATTGALTQSWLIALAALAIAGIGGYFLGYRKALDKRALAIPSGASFILTLALTLILARLNYTQPVQVPGNTSIDQSMTYHLSFPGWQLYFGVICGSITALCTVITAFIWHRTVYGYRSRKSSRHLTIVHLIWIGLLTFGAGIGTTTGVAAILTVANLGLGWWEPTGNMMVCGFLLASFLFIGLGCSIPIWRTAVTPSRLETK